jgi:hypothetical protein
MAWRDLARERVSRHGSVTAIALIAIVVVLVIIAVAWRLG